MRKERGKEMRKHILIIGGNEGLVNFRKWKFAQNTTETEVRYRSIPIRWVEGGGRWI